MLRMRKCRLPIWTLGLAVAISAAAWSQPPVPPEPIPQEEDRGASIPGIGPVGDVKRVATGFQFTGNINCYMIRHD